MHSQLQEEEMQLASSFSLEEKKKKHAEKKKIPSRLKNAPLQSCNGNMKLYKE